MTPIHIKQWTSLSFCLLLSTPMAVLANDTEPWQVQGEYYVFGAVADTVQPTGHRDSAAGLARLSAQWVSSPTGQLHMTIDHRHGLTSLPPSQWLPAAVGARSVIGAPFSDQGWRLTHAYWDQTGWSGKVHAMAGYLDSTDFIDLYPYGSPYSGFTNLHFSTGSGTIVLPDEASIGGMIRDKLSPHYYLQLSVSDASADSSHPWQRAGDVFHDGRTFEAVELGWVADPDQALMNQFHVTGWQSDGGEREREPQAGMSFSWTAALGAWTPFLRGGIAHGSQVLYSTSVVAGTGYEGIGSGALGMAVGWGQANEDKEVVHNAELFYRLPLGALTLTPTIQYVAPLRGEALAGHSWIMGLRARLTTP
ncbi:hypothetical protein J8Z26_22730 [Vibrio sp. SCSIO 43169]|nr:hypothetical protein [Vibrio sp. SCSIO 43169]